MTIIRNIHVTFPSSTPPPEPIELTPTISMDRNTFYKTQKSVWSTPYTGLLTDKAIARYQKKGTPLKHEPKQKKVVKMSKMQQVLQALLCDL